MEIPVVAVSVVAVFAVLRRFAVRRVAAREGRFVWLVFAPTLIGAVVILLVGIRSLSEVPFGGAAMILAGGLYLGVVVRFLARLSRSVSLADPQADLGTAMTEPVTDYLTTMVGLILLGGIVAVVGLIAWGVIRAAS